MAKTPKTLSKSEIAAQKKDLAVLRKTIAAEHAKFVSDDKAARKALAAVQKDADKAVAAANKVVVAAASKLAKATDKAAAGFAKIDAKLAALSPAKNEEATA